MSCFRPIVFHDLGINKETGKRRVIFVRNFQGDYENYDSKRYIRVPCGRCIGCRLDYARVWGERCSLEASQYKENMFLTLTYNDENLPLKVSKKDFDLFIKRLRNHFKDRKIRFFGCGEYGSKGRAHYHIIVFNGMFDDLKYLTTKNGNPYYTSKTLESLRSYGFSLVGDCTFKSCNYTARYILKKQIGNNKSDEFVKMSRKPGIGREYFENHKDEFLIDNMIHFSFDENKKHASINRYFKKLYENLDYETNDELDKIARKRIEEKMKSEMQALGLEKQIDYYNLKKDIKKSHIKSLKRSI